MILLQNSKKNEHKGKFFAILFGRYTFFPYFCSDNSLNNSQTKILLPIDESLLHNKIKTI